MLVNRTIFKSLLTAASLLTAFLTGGARASEDWSFAGEVYGWLPTIESEAAGTTTEISRGDLLEDLDFTAMFALRAYRENWSLNTDVIYFDISDKIRAPLDETLELKKLGLEAWIVTPTVGYQIVSTDSYRMEVYGGGRFLWIEANLDLESLPSPGVSTKVSESSSNWDAIIGVRGRYEFADRWAVNYAADIGAGESDSVLQANLGLGYRFERVETVFGWRYLDYDIGSDTSPEELTVNGPYAGLVFRF